MGFWNRFKQSVHKTSRNLSSGLLTLFTNKQRIDELTLDNLEDFLIQHDFGVHFAQDIRKTLENHSDQDVSFESMKRLLCQRVESILTPYEGTFEVKSQEKRPLVFLLCGVNGSGKTTTLPKLTLFLKKVYPKIAWVAADTFRAAACDQLLIWSQRLGVHCYQKAGADPASLVFDSYQSAVKEGVDLLIVDTAGRLHNNHNLMDELEKMTRVLKKADALAPHERLLILDGTVGQNALRQVELFHNKAEISGLIMTKLDGTSKGGILLPLVQTYNIPIKVLTFGEYPEDFASFNAHNFSQSLFE